MNFSDKLGSDHLCIFLLHGVTKENNYSIRNYTGKHIQESDFDMIIEDLSKKGTALSMDQVIEHHQNNTPYPPFSFSITFDDGFENNASVALPILEQYEVPGLIYITTSWTEVNGMSWTDRLEYCLEYCEDKSFKLPWNQNSVTVSSKDEKIQLMDDIRYHVKRLDDLNIEDFISHFYQQANMDLVSYSSDPLDLKLSWEKIRKLDEHSLITIGGHTHTHRIMSFLSYDELKYEINTSLDLLQKNSNIKTQHYSYPEGLSHTFNDQVISELKKAGIKCSPSAMDGINTPKDSLFHLKRVMIG